MQLYVGLKRNEKWYRNTDVSDIDGGGLAALDGVDKSGAARLLNLLKKSIIYLENDAGESYELNEHDYMDIYVVDAEKIARAAMKKINNVDKLVNPEFFYCHVCSHLGDEKYTKQEVDWDDLIAEGELFEYYLKEDEEPYFWTTLPDGFAIQQDRALVGGTFFEIKRELLTIGKMLKLQKNKTASESEANMIRYAWDAEIIEVKGMASRDFDLLVKKAVTDSFSKKYIRTQKDQDAMKEAEDEFKVGLDAERRSVMCRICHEEIGGYLDFTNFFQSLLPKSFTRKRLRD
jgi:hypothetical protein